LTFVDIGDSNREMPRSAYLESSDILLVMRPGTANDPDIYLALHADGTVSAFNGHVDLGTGIRTALAQIVAEELDIAFEQVSMVLGTTTAAPDQGPTIASETIQVAAVPLRRAAATARWHLVQIAGRQMGVALETLRVENGRVWSSVLADRSITFGELISGKHERIEIDAEASLKPISDYRIVGTPQKRNDIAAKATGEWTYVHDVRIPDMLHGRVVRPPHAGFDQGPHVGHSLLSVDESSIADVPGVVSVVVVGDFVGVVATREEYAVQAAETLKVRWRTPPQIPDLNRPEQALRDNPATQRILSETGDVQRGLESASPRMDRTYVWPYQMHASIGPSCAVASFQPDRLIVWSGTQNPFPMRRDLALLLDMPEEAIVVERLEAAGCYGRNCADDVTADAALLSRAVGRPVRVQLTRAQEHGWEPKGAAQVIDVRGGLDLEGGPAAYDFETRYPSNISPTLALVLTGRVASTPDIAQMGDRTAIPPYAFGNMRVAVHDMPPIARASWFRGVSAMPNSFAHESFIDELAFAAGVDPVEYRLRYLTDPRAIDLVHAVTAKAEWMPRTRPGTAGREGDILYGRGFAYALYVHGKFPGTPAAWSAWVADVAVNRQTGEIAVTRVTVGQDSGLMINPDGVRHQIHGNVIQSVSRTLKEKVEFSQTAVESVEWGGYPIITFPEVPEIDVLMLPRPDEEPRGAGESASVPSAAAICNAVYDATGIRFRELPLTPDKVLAALREAEGSGLPPPEKTDAGKKKRWWKAGLGFAGLLGVIAGGITLSSPLRGAYPAVPRPDPGLYSAATIAQGRLVAAAGGCNVCHEGNDGLALAGGRSFETPFGMVFATNVTPDSINGIGGWSYPAFERAMRQGISRDGHHLYPVHPYTAFSGTSENDMQSLYAYLMTQAPVQVSAPKTALAFPFNIRPLMAGWNALFLKSPVAEPVPAMGLLGDPVAAELRRGEYLVETLGHCSACHTERNGFGAEKTGAAHLAGGYADGWEAPSIKGAGAGPLGWSVDALYDYLRTGHSADHGSAGGPMAAVVQSLQPLPDADIRAMAGYLASLGDTVPQIDATEGRTVLIEASDAAAAQAAMVSPQGARIFEGACSSCHNPASPLASLALNSNLHSARPDNLLQAILHGMDAPANMAARAKVADVDVMSMPGFSTSFSNRQLGELTAYLRARFAPGKPGWQNVDQTTERLRKSAEAF
jgi:nicotinate dehydrogenase subunit B